jgi:hypothetical protein
MKRRIVSSRRFRWFQRALASLRRFVILRPLRAKIVLLLQSSDDVRHVGELALLRS